MSQGTSISRASYQHDAEELMPTTNPEPRKRARDDETTMTNATTSKRAKIDMSHPDYIKSLFNRFINNIEKTLAPMREKRDKLNNKISKIEEELNKITARRTQVEHNINKVEKAIGTLENICTTLTTDGEEEEEEEIDEDDDI